jgi:hypothetical protein
MASKDKLEQLVVEHLSAGEQVLLTIAGTYETKIMGSDTVRSGILAATDKRLVFFAKKMTGFDFESFPYENISSFERSKNLMGGSVRFVASGNTVSMKWIQDPALAEFAEYIHSRMGKNSSINLTNISAQSIPEQISALAELHKSGVLTDEEFSSKKKDLLDRM